MASDPNAMLSPYHPPYRQDSGGDVPPRSAMTPEQQFLAELAVIERVIAWICVRRGLRGADAEDFGSLVKTRLIENDYAMLAKFQGRSSLKTYLTAVINRIYLDFQVQRFGKWRPSAKARQLSPIALRLERLMYRDGLSFDEACGVLLSDTRVGETRDALHAIRQQIPERRPPGRPVALPPGTLDGGAAAVEQAERQRLAERTFSIIRRTLAGLPARERMFLRLHFESDFSVAEAARVQGLDQKALYRRKDSILKLLKDELERGGISAEDARALVSNVDWDAALSADPSSDVQSPEQPGPRPSQGHGPTARQEGGR
jgi:RNA polymerase sigma factor (sigma-70 family)